jgi:hypothetical protein
MKQDSIDVTTEKLDAILSVLQDLVIIEGAKAGLTKGTVRSILRVNNARIGRTWKHLKNLQKKPVGS